MLRSENGSGFWRRKKRSKEEPEGQEPIAKDSAFMLRNLGYYGNIEAIG